MTEKMVYFSLHKCPDGLIEIVTFKMLGEAALPPDGSVTLGELEDAGIVKVVSVVRVSAASATSLGMSLIRYAGDDVS